MSQEQTKCICLFWASCFRAFLPPQRPSSACPPGMSLMLTSLVLGVPAGTTVVAPVASVRLPRVALSSPPRWVILEMPEPGRESSWAETDFTPLARAGGFVEERLVILGCP